MVLRTTTILLTLGVLGTSYAAPPPTQIPDIPYELYKLGNGLEVILHEDHSTPIVGVNIWYHVGSKNERTGRSGFAHLFEHMMFQGSEHQDAEYFGPIHGAGGAVNGSTSEDRTNYWEFMPSRRAGARSPHGCGSHGLALAGHDAGEARQPDDGGAQRTA